MKEATEKGLEAKERGESKTAESKREAVEMVCGGCLAYGAALNREGYDKAIPGNSHMSEGTRRRNSTDCVFRPRDRGRIEEDNSRGTSSRVAGIMGDKRSRFLVGVGGIGLPLGDY